MRDIFNLKYYPKENKIWVIIRVIAGLLGLLYFITITHIKKNSIYLLLGIFFCLFLYMNVIIAKQKKFYKVVSDVIIFLFSTYILLSNYSNYGWNEPVLRILFPLIIIIYMVLYFYYADAIFNKAWKNNFINFQKDWYNIKKITYNTIYIIIILATFTTVFLHFFNALLFYIEKKSFSIDSFHQLMIGSLLVILYFNYKLRLIGIESSKKNGFEKFYSLIKENARIIFHTGIIFFFFDTLLEIYRIIEQGSLIYDNLLRLIFNFIALILAFKLVYLQENFTVLRFLKSPKLKDDI